MAMTKKHYTAVAKAINNVMWQTDTDPATVAYIIAALSDIFADDNPRFDKNRFMQACTANRDTVSQTGDSK